MQSDSTYKDVVDATNMAAYARTGTVDWYKDFEFILKPEAVILEAIGPAIKDKKLLDIGIGGGRTTKFLLEISSDYTGIDYTADFITAARQRFPKANLLCCDARNLDGFADATFDFVLFSFNAIDYMIHEDRLSCLAEINRVLKPGGWFMFSTHNRDYRHFDKYPWQERRFDLNHLKKTNDTYGHAAGDAVLAHFAEVLSKNVRDSDCVGRLGGDEFGVLLSHANQTQALKKADSLAATLQATPTQWNGQAIPVTFAYGAFELKSGDNPDVAIARADQAMYAHKKAQRSAAE